ncbi:MULTISPECIES: SDR family NAD(P)-dependent oxidoreductase [Rhodococcus]|uniref:SDR family NAD(P)-dependent oxidoreductase n=1 Tax=Rhodococcus TaxID=1827 RepID=UPI001E351170|nr:SDR family oxidoreductase [Rhodococcus rhodochrous]MCD2097554.1 SDR family oxidoreductase [Rhodococcus rhodochrous]MCD2122776.1 SDR family oxidoreductase [Rhodococcus rhodochrous]MCQ4133665.1 SDR family oxidoreductase [Rhodococcus rhodochrous]MDJ0018170.1 SDR family oxidoreductase [Rhodococcus rhodochrous]
MTSALVTGASRGIGLGIATRLAERGYALTISARGAERLESVAERLREAGAKEVRAVAADLADPEATARVVETHREAFGSMKALILNAGVGTAGPIAEFPARRFDKTVAVNLNAPFALIQASLPLLRAEAESDPARGSKIVALSSITGVYAEAGLAAYGATKAALISLVETLNAEESGNGISASALAPAYVDTDMSDWIKDKIPAESMIEVNDVVEIVDALLKLSSRAVVPKLVLSRAGAGLYTA